MVRKSVKAEQRDIVDKLLAEAGIDVQAAQEAGVAVKVTAAEYDAWITVSVALAEKADKTGAPLPELLAGESGGDAAQMYAAVEARLKRAAKKHGRPAYPEPPPTDPDADRELLERLTQLRREPTRLTRLDVFRYSAARALQLGFSPEAVWAKEQGRRTDAELRDVRAQIVLELRGQNATLPDIGAVFGGRTKQSISALVERAKANRKRGAGNA